MLDIDAIEKRALAASPGTYTYSPKEGLVLCGDRAIAMMSDGDGLEEGTAQADRDGELFAHASEDVLALVARVRELEKRLERAEPDLSLSFPCSFRF